jgi:hypothetical protein
MLVMTAVVVQAGLIFYAQSIALAASTVGVNAARQNGGQPAAGKTAAEDFLRRVPPVLTGVEVTPTSTATTVTITVRARAFNAIWLPGFDFKIIERANRPIERFVS